MSWTRYDINLFLNHFSTIWTLCTGETKNSVNLPNEKYSAENVVWQIVKYFASQDDDSIPRSSSPHVNNQFWIYQFFHEFYILEEKVVINSLFVTSNHQTTSFFPLFFLRLAVEKENKLFIGPKLREKNCFRPINGCFLFQLLQLRKIRGKKLGKTKLVVWCYEQILYHDFFL